MNRSIHSGDERQDYPDYPPGYYESFIAYRNAHGEAETSSAIESNQSTRKQKKKIPDNIRWLIWERDNFTCMHCGSRCYLSIDHIKPESKGGTLALDNLQTLCKPCNSAKGAKSCAT